MPNDSRLTKEAINIAVGDIVSGLAPEELVEIRSIQPFGSKTLIEAVGADTARMIKRPLSDEEIAKLAKIRGSEVAYDGDAEAFLLGSEAHRIRIAYQFDPLFAVSSSIVDPLPHQVEAVYRYLLPLPRIRFLLADDTGAGKTIMAGLLLKELIFRGTIQKILVITPGGLTKQWQEDELQGKFGLSFRLVNRESFNAQPDQFARYDSGKFVVSIDYLARNEACLQAASQTSWDFIIVDEAHKLSAYEYGSKLEESQRYQALKQLQNKTEHLLFLTATPHRGRKDTFRRLLQLLDVDLFQKDEHVTHHIQDQTGRLSSSETGEESLEKARSRFFLRRLKEEMVNWDRKPLFKERHTSTVGYDLTPEEKDLYDQVTHYVRTKRKEAKAKKNQNVALTLMVMQRRLTSSIQAITKTLHNRLAALNEVLDIINSSEISPTEKRRLTQSMTYDDDPGDIAEYESLTEEERDKIDERRRECRLRREYLENAFTDLILDLQAQLNEHQQENLFGAENVEELQRLEERLKELRRRKVERLEELDLMENLTANLPDVLGQAVILPPKESSDIEASVEPVAGVPMQRDEEVEAIAMQVAAEYEQGRGWTPHDISGDGEHYDIRSESPDGEKRFIEVKGRAQTGAIQLTAPELDKLRQLGERAWLYIVTMCRSESPRLRIIQNPLSKLDPGELYKRIQYVVRKEQWSAHGEDVT